MHSMRYATLDIVNQRQNNMDKKLFSSGIFINLKKAFDTVDHIILLHKLQYYGIRGIAKDRFSSYLPGHTQIDTKKVKNILQRTTRVCIGPFVLY